MRRLVQHVFMVVFSICIVQLSFGAMEAAATTQQTIQGRVTDAEGAPLSGASVSVVGTAVASMTDENGNYTIQAAQGSVLRISMLGFLPQEIRVDGTQLNVSLTAGDVNLEEVVVVGYGVQKKAHLTGAVSSVNADEVFNSRPIPDAGRGLQGVIPGLSIAIPSGEVGSDPLIRIRGQIGSIAGSAEPLILVDNVEIPSIQMINPNDIETVTVLKDASAAAIYGAKAAFGVLLITTKKGASIETDNITYSTNFAWQAPSRPFDIAGIDGLEYTLEAHENMKQPGPAGGFWRVSRESFERIKQWQAEYGDVVGPYDPVVFNRDWYFDGNDKFGLRLYDPAGVMVKDRAFSQIHNLSLAGRRGNTNYNLSAGFTGQEGMMRPAPHDDFRRFTSSLSVSTRVTDFLSVRGTAMYSDATKRYPFSATGFGADPWLYLYRWSRLFPTGVQELGERIRDPYTDTQDAHTAYDQNRFTNLSIGTTVDFTSNWDLQADYTFSSRFNSDRWSLPTFEGGLHWYAPVAWLDEAGNRVYVDEQGNITESGGVPGYRFPMTEYVGSDQSYYHQASLGSARHTVNAFSTYSLNLDDKHDIKLMVGTNIVAYRWNNHWSRRGDLINRDNPQFGFTVGTPTVGGDAYWDSQAGFFGRANYSFMDKYLLEASLRYDGTSIFPQHLRWQWYPSISGGWVVSQEQFMQSLNPVLSFAKLRASWGSIGDQSVPNNLYIPRMGFSQNNWLAPNGDRYFQLGTPPPVSANISWQRIEHLNLGADFRFFNNRLGLVAEWFQRDTRDMIIPGDALPATFGASAPQGNFGNLRTRGWELAADYSHIFDNGLRITANANISDAVTTITKGADYQLPWENRSLGNQFATGRRYGDVYGYVTDRLFQKDDFVYDANGDFVQTTIIFDGVAKQTNVLAGDNPVYQTYFEDGNQVMLISPGDVKFVDVDGDGYITPGTNTFGNPGDQVVIGNTTPRYQYGFRLGADFKGFDLSVFLQGVGQRAIWGNGQLAIPGYHVRDGAMPQTFAGDFWKEDRTDAFYPRAWHLGGVNSGFVMRPQSRYMLDMSYLRVKNITLGYTLPQHLLNRVKLSNTRIFLSLENILTFDNLRGLPIDPEAISGYSMLQGGGNYNLGRTGTSNPTFSSASVGIQIGL